MRRLLLAATLALAAGPSLADGFVIGPGRWSCADAVRIWGAEMTPPKGQLAGWILGYWTAESFRREKAFVDRVEAAGGLRIAEATIQECRKAPEAQLYRVVQSMIRNTR